MKRNKESKARIRVFNYYKLKKNAQLYLDSLVKKYEITYWMLLKEINYDDFVVEAIVNSYRLEIQVDDFILMLKNDFNNFTKYKTTIRKIEIIKKKNDCQGVSSCHYYCPNIDIPFYHNFRYEAPFKNNNNKL